MYFLLFIFLIIPNYSFAYLDPVSGSWFLQLIALGISSLIVFFKQIKKKLSAVYEKFFKKK